MSHSGINGSGSECGRPKLLLHVIDTGQGLAALLQQESTFFFYDIGYKDDQHGKAIKLAIKRLIKSCPKITFGALIFSKRSAVELLLKDDIIKEALVTLSTNVDPEDILKNAIWKEVDRLPLDHPSAICKDDKLLRDLSIQYCFNRKYPLIKYHMSKNNSMNDIKSNQIKKSDNQVQLTPKGSIKNTELQEACVSKEKVEVDFESSVLVHISPVVTDYPPVLITGCSPIAHFGKLKNCDDRALSVFFVPHVKSKECFSLLPAEVRNLICNTKAIKNSALHLALYHMRESFAATVGRLKGTKLEERGKSFLCYYRNNSHPERDLECMLQDPEAKVSQFLYSDNSQLNWYKKQLQNVFSEISGAVSEEECRQQSRMELFRNSLAWAHFYKHINAELFVMSAENLSDKYTHAILNGIIISNVWRKTKCSIVITDHLPYSLDEVIQRDVRRIAFPNGKSNPLVQVAFLDNDFPERQQHSFFTIDPWSEKQSHVASDFHTISMNTVEQMVQCVASEYQLHLIRDDLDMKERLSTKVSNEIIGHITHSHRPPLSKSCYIKCMLETYLKEIGFKVPCTSYGLDEVLKCLLGPVLVDQLRNIASNSNPNIEIIPELLKQKARGNSEFKLMPTKCSAIEADIGISISRRKPLLVANKKITSARVAVKKAKTELLKIIFEVNINSKVEFLHVVEYLDLSKSCGTTIADHIHGICCKEDAWFPAKELTVGEVFYIYFGKEKSLTLMKSLPTYLSYPLSNCKINHYLTTVLVDSSQSLQEAHMYVTDKFDLALVNIKQVQFSISINSLAIHIFPSLSMDKFLLHVEGKCTVNGSFTMKFSCSSTQDSNKSMKFFFDERMPPKLIFEIFQIQTLPSKLNQPEEGVCLSDSLNYEGGFVLTECLHNSEEAIHSSLFFGADLGNDFTHLLPTCLSHIQGAKTSITMHYPTKNPKLGIEASFTSILDTCSSKKSEKIVLDCCLSVSPSALTDSYKYEISIGQSGSDKSQSFKGMSINSLIAALNFTQGRSIVEEIETIPHLGQQVLHNMAVTKVLLKVSDKEIQDLEIQANISKLDLIPNKFSVHECSMSLLYSNEGLQLDCKGCLTFLRHYQYFVQFNLPTSEKNGRLDFKSYTDDLKLRFLLEELGWLLSVKANPILAEVLDTVIRYVGFEFSVLPKQGKLQITSADINVYKDMLDVNVVVLHDVDLTISTKWLLDSYVHTFSLGAYISDVFYARLQYTSDDHVMSGIVSVAFSKFISAADTLKTFRPSSSSYDSMKTILNEEFMDVFNSDLRILAQPGMTATLNISIGLPFGNSKFILKHLKLEVEDALKICCKNTYMLNNFQFEYHNLNDTAISHLFLDIYQLNSKQNMSFDFNFTSNQDNTRFFKAMVKAGPQGGFLKLSSAIDLANAVVPGLPKFEVGLPPIFDIEVSSGSVTFATKPSFKVSAFDINILITEWQVFGDPELKVHQLTLKTNWKAGEYPQLSFADCSLTFLEHRLDLMGKLTTEEVYIECSSAKKFSDTKAASFQSVLQDCTPASEDKPVIPANIGLPPMEVELKEFIVQLKEKYRKFRVHAEVVSNSWVIRLGSHHGAPVIPVHNLGGALEWERKDNKTIYKAFLYGNMKMFGMDVYMEMLLGKNIDAIVSAVVENPKRLYYSQIADNMISSETMVPYDKYDPETSGLSQIAPASVHGISFTSASVFINVTKKQFFLSSQVSGWGIGSILIGFLVNKHEMDYVVSLSVEDGFKFSRLSETLAFVDELLYLQTLNILISSTDISNLADLTNHFSHSFSAPRKMKKPFYESKLISSNKLSSEFKIQEGTTIYAEVDIRKSQGGINNILKLGDDTLLDANISVMAYIGKANTNTSLEVHAWISKLLLFGMLEFSNIHVVYKVHKDSEFELSGTVALNFELKDSSPFLQFNGMLSVDSSHAKFTTRSCRDIVSQPCGIRVKVHDLCLALVMHLNGDCPDVLVSGGLEMGRISFNCKFFLKGVTFKVFQIKINHPLKLSALFYYSAIDWPIQLDIVVQEGMFYYAASESKFEENGSTVQYEGGYHLEAVITILNCDFRIKADIPSDRSDVVISGRSIEPIDFDFAKITGIRPHAHEGPELKYRGSEKSLSLTIGVEILKHPCFEGELKYLFVDKALEGTIRYPGRFLCINEPSMKIRWSKDDGFEVVDFEINGDIPGFSLLAAIAKYAKIIYNIVSGILSWSVNLHVKTGKNPDPNRHLLKLILYGELVIKVIGFEIPVLPLPEVPILLPRMDDFTFSKLPKYILKCLWDSAGPICLSLLKWINPWNLIKQSAKLIWNGVKQVGKAVVNVAKKIGGAIKSGIRKIGSWFGFSAFIIDEENGMVLGYIRGGKGGHELCNEHYIIEQFGPILTVNAIGAMAHDIHRHYKTCVDAQDKQDDSETQDMDDEVDGDNVDLEKHLDTLKSQAEELSVNSTIVADKVLVIQDTYIHVNDTNENIVVEWFTYNPEEEIFYTEDKGDIEYHIKIKAIVVECNMPKVVKLYNEVFLNSNEKECGEDKAEINGDDIQQQNQDPQIRENTLNGAEQDVYEEDKTADGIEQQDDETVLGTCKSKKLTIAMPLQDELVEVVQETVSNNQMNTHSMEVEQDLSFGVHENKELIDAAQKPALNDQLNDQDNCYANENDPVIHSEESTDEIKEAGLSGQFNDKIKPPKLKKKCSLTIPFKSELIKHTVCLHVSIQPKVTLEVKMLPPDKIATEDYMIDPERLKENDKSWMEDVKKDIIETGRINEVTLEGSRVSFQHTIQMVNSSAPRLVFTAQYYLAINNLKISGNITSMFEANSYLVQLVDEKDQTVIIKQLWMPSQKLQYAIEAKASDFPKTSSGPYYISAMAFNADLNPCSAISKSDQKIDRYFAPDQLNISIPNLDSSHSDIIKLEWRYSKEITSINEAVIADIKDDHSDLNEPKNFALHVQKDSSHLHEQVDQILHFQHSDSQETPMDSSDDCSPQIKNKHFYSLVISGIHIERLKDFKECEVNVNVSNVDISGESFEISTPIYIKQDSQEVVHHEFSLKEILKENKHEIRGGILFQCQVVTDGNAKLPSMPKFFPEFILLASPMNFKATAATEIAGFQIEWDYSAHAIEYRLELVNEYTANVAFSKIIKCTEGSHGKVILCNSDFEDISSFISNTGSYNLHIYSLGFGQELIRCLKPSVASGKFHFIQSSIQYIKHSDTIEVKFVPLVRAQYVVRLYQKNQKGDISKLAKISQYCNKAKKETVIFFQVKKLWHLIRSGNSVYAWIYCIAKGKGCKVTYIGAPQEDTHVLNSPKLKGCLSNNSNCSFNSIQLTWHSVQKAEIYQYGYYFSETKECISLKETQETEVVITFEDSLLELLHNNYCQFKVYVVAKDKSGTGELSLYSTIFQCIKSESLNYGGIVYSSATLQQHVWFKHYAINKPLALCNPQHILFPSGMPFPRLRVPKKFLSKFWETDFSLFGTGHLYTRDVLDTKKGKQKVLQQTWKRIDPFEKPYVKRKDRIGRAKLCFLFHTRCSAESASGKKIPQQIDVEIIIELKTTSKKSSNVGAQATSDNPITAVDHKLNKDTKVGTPGVHEVRIDNFQNDAVDDITEGEFASEKFLEKSKDGEDQTEDYTEPKDKSDSRDQTECNADIEGESLSDTYSVSSSEAVGDHGGILESEDINQLQTTQTLAEHKSTTKKSEGRLKYLENKAKIVAASVLEGVSSVASTIGEATSSIKAKVGSYITSQTYREVYRKKVTISLPFKHGPKIYNRIIRYRIADCNLTYSPVVTVKITSTSRANHEDTHLFMRFTQL